MIQLVVADRVAGRQPPAGVILADHPHRAQQAGDDLPSVDRAGLGGQRRQWIRVGMQVCGARGAPDAVQAAGRGHLWHIPSARLWNARSPGTSGTLRRPSRRGTQEPAPPPDPAPRTGADRQPSILHVYHAYLRERWSSGGTNVVVAGPEIRDRRYHDSCRQVRTYVARFRGNAAVPAPPPAPPKARTVTGWIMTRPGEPADADRASLNAILVVHR